MDLLLIRHGESLADVEGRVEGGGWDPPLTERGLAQARALADRLVAAGYRCDLLCASSMVRAVQTAQAVAAAIGAEVVTDDRLREMHLGFLSGLHKEEADRRWPVPAQGWMPHQRVPGGECALDHYYRVAQFYLELLERYGDASVCCVAHGGTLTMLVRMVYGLPLDQSTHLHCFRFTFDDVSMSRFIIKGPRDVHTLYLNDCSHARHL